MFSNVTPGLELMSFLAKAWVSVSTSVAKVFIPDRSAYSLARSALTISNTRVDKGYLMDLALGINNSDMS
jgi:hypothetical protein